MVKFHKISLLCLFLLAFSFSAYSQQRTVTGVVKDESGESVIGAVIVEKGTLNATTSGVDGSFRLTVPSAEVTLVVSSLGFDTREAALSPSLSTINITLKAQNTMIEEVVVLGLSQTRRVNVTGAVGTIEGRDIATIPVANVTSLLVGNVPGVTGLQSSGEPGHNGTDLRIRGVASYAGYSQPLIVIDGVEQDYNRAYDMLNSMDPNEISGISVLKDAATTAVYGIKGANGVIIVTTKRGTVGAPIINFSSNFGLTQASQMQQGTTAYEYALLRNEAVYNDLYSFAGSESLLSRLYSENDLWKFKNNRDFTPREVDAMNLTPQQKEQLKNSPALYYKSQDLYKEQFNKVAPQWGANFNIRGGTDRVKYFASLAYFQQEGITTTTKYYDANTRSNYQRYNYRANFDIDVTKNLRISVNSAGQFGQAQGPGANNDPWDLTERYKTIMQYIYDANPFISPGIIDGKLISGFAGESGSVQNPLANKTASSIGNQNALLNLINAGMNTIYNSMLDNSIKISHTMDYLLEGLKVRGTVSYQDNYNRRVQFWPSVPSYTAQRNLENPNIIEFFGGNISGNGFSSYGYDNWNKLYLDAAIEWGNNFNGHDIQAIFLGKGVRYELPNDSFNVASGLTGFAARVAYNYRDRYMLEFNIGYNGTANFDVGRRFGVFPAVSAGWVLTEEKFFPKNDYLTFLKLRVSYGEIGNDQIGNRRFLYLPSTYYTNQSGYWFGNSTNNSANPYFPGATEGDLGYPGVTWERAKKYDAGLEFSMFSDRLKVEADYFYEKRNNILTTLGIIEAVFGVPASRIPPANVGRTKNQGFEIAASWTDRIGEFKYSIGGDVSYAKNKILYRAEAPNPYYWMNQTGFSIGQRHGYISDGFYNTEEELANRPYHKFCSDRVTLGDIRYKDLNGDDVIDEKDKAPIGYPNFPEFIYNFKLGLNYKNFDVRVLFTGTAHGSYYLNSGITMPFYKTAGNAWKWQYDGRWTPEKAANGDKITYPRVSISPSTGDNNYAASDFWMASSDFFKIKNIEIGYTIKLKRFNARIYANANNLATFGASRLRDIGIDPEIRDGSGYIYPLTKVYNVGFNLQF